MRACGDYSYCKLFIKAPFYFQLCKDLRHKKWSCKQTSLWEIMLINAVLFFLFHFNIISCYFYVFSSTCVFINLLIGNDKCFTWMPPHDFSVHSCLSLNISLSLSFCVIFTNAIYTYIGFFPTLTNSITNIRHSNLCASG